MLLLSQFLSDLYLKELMHVHITASRISEILIRNQPALIKDERLCHWHSGCLLFTTPPPPPLTTRPTAKMLMGFFSHLTAQLLLASHADLIFICGETSARVGDQTDLLTDQIEDIYIPKKKIIDFTTNKHGSLMIDFCKAVGFCMLNGRCPHDNSICIKQGRYMLLTIYNKWSRIKNITISTGLL